MKNTDTPCDLIPSDLPSLLEKFNMTLSEFSQKYLIALLIASPQYADEVLMMVPVRVDDNGNRTNKLLADHKYLNEPGRCIFLKDNKCSINEQKPFGGRFLECAKITGSVPIQLQKNQYFAYWCNNQHLFELVRPGFTEILNELRGIFQRMNEIHHTERENKEYKQLGHQRAIIIEQKLYPLFNNSPPEEGISVLLN